MRLGDSILKNVGRATVQKMARSKESVLNSKEDPIGAPAVSFALIIGSFGVGWPLVLVVTVF